MGIQFEASRLRDYFPPCFRRHVHGTVISVYNVADEAINTTKGRGLIPTTDMNDSEDRQSTGSLDRELWFKIIQDGQVFANNKEVDSLALAIAKTNGVVDEFGLFTILPTEFLESVGVLIFTSATPENMVFLCLYMAHLRSAVLFHTALAHQKNRKVNSTFFSQMLRQQWIGGEDQRKRPVNPELWVDCHTDVKKTNTLPLIFAGSSAHRIFPLIARELYVSAGSKNIRALLWESLYIENLIRAHDSNFAENAASERENNRILCTSHGCSPFTFWFCELVLSSITALKDTERCVFDINEMMRAIHIEAHQTGGRVDNYLFDMRFGKRVFRSLILTPSIDPDPAATMLGRLSPGFGESYRKDADLQDRFKADLVSVNNSFSGLRFNELEFVRTIKSIWLNPKSLITTIHVPLGITDAISMILLCQLLWLTIPTLRDKAMILVASPNSTLICNTTRLLIDSFAPQIRDMFITTRTYLISALLDGIKKKTAGTLYLENLNQLDEQMNSIKMPFKLIISTPDSIEEGWSREIYTKYIHNDPSAQLITVRGAEIYKDIMECVPAPTASTLLPKDIIAGMYKSLSELLFNVYFNDDPDLEVARDRQDIAMNDGGVATTELPDGSDRLENLVSETFNKLRSSTDLAAPQRNYIASMTVWEELPTKGSYILLDRAIHLNKIRCRFESSEAHLDEPFCVVQRNALNKHLDPFEFTRSLLDAPYYYFEGHTPIVTPHLDLRRTQIDVHGIEVVQATLDPQRVILATQPVTTIPKVHQPDQPTIVSAAPATTAPSEDDWLLGLLKGLGNAVQDLRSEKDADITGKKVSKRASLPPNSTQSHPFGKLHCALSAQPPARTLMVENTPNCDQIVHSVYHRIMSVMNYEKTEVPRVIMDCKAESKPCRGQSCRGMHRVKVSSKGFSLVHLGVLRELTSRKQV